MPATYEPIATSTLGSAAASFTFSAIPATYTDLRLIVYGIPANATAQYPVLRFNGDTGTNYSRVTLLGTGAVASTGRNNTQSYVDITYTDFITSGHPMMWQVDVFSYAASVNKTCLVTNSADQNGSGSVLKVTGLWRNTAAITSITITSTGGANAFATNSMATLYGIKAA
jgi:hypothetical protein